MSYTLLIISMGTMASRQKRRLSFTKQFCSCGWIKQQAGCNQSKRRWKFPAPFFKYV